MNGLHIHLWSISSEVQINLCKYEPQHSLCKVEFVFGEYMTTPTAYTMNALKCRTLGATRARTLKTHALYNAHERFPQDNGVPYVCFQQSSAGSPQRSGFRENPTNF